MKFVVFFAALISVLGWPDSCHSHGNQILFDDPKFDTWVRNVTNWQDFGTGFLSFLPVSVKKTFCRKPTEEGMKEVIGELKLKIQLNQLDFLPIKQNS